MNPNKQYTGLGVDPIQAQYMIDQSRRQREIGNEMLQVPEQVHGWQGVLLHALKSYMGQKQMQGADKREKEAVSGLRDFYKNEQLRERSREELEAQRKRMAEFDKAKEERKRREQAAKSMGLEGRNLAEFMYTGKVPEQSTPTEFGYFLQNATPEQRDAFIARKAQGGSGQTINVNSGEEFTPFQEKLAAQQATLYGEWQREATAANSALSTLSDLERGMESLETGKIEEAKAIAGQYFGTDAASNMQAFNAKVGQLVMEELNKMKGPATEKEREYLQQLMPRVGNDSRANKEILRYLKDRNARAVTRFEQAQEYANQTGGLQGFQPQYQGSMFQAPEPQAEQGKDDPLGLR